MTRHPLTGYPAFRPLEEIERMKTERGELLDFLAREGYRRCDIAACNCGSYHGGHALRRLQEIYEALGGCNGTLPIPEIKRIISERDTAIARLSDIREIAECYEDGAPDAPAYAKAMTRIAAIAAGEVVP